MSAPTSVGRLRLLRPIGSGGFAVVWLAEDPELDAQVAVKILAENWATNADIRRRFLDEARLLRRLDSDHLVRVYDIGQMPDGRPYFVMTYADGGTLEDQLALRPAPWPPDAVLGVVDDIAAALSVLHQHGIVHRDVKPSNVLFRTAAHPARPTAQRVLLGDLGIAKDLQWASGLTVAAGSPPFMAPEQNDPAGRVSPASDVHGFAMTTACLLGLAAPWPPTPVADVVRRATTADPSERIPTVADFAAQLHAVLAAWRGAVAPMPVPPPPIPVQTAAPPGSLPPRAAPPRRRRVRAAGVAALALMVALAGWWALPDRRLTPVDGGASVEIPRGWTQVAGAAFPGEDDADDGARAGRDGRSITVAFSSTYASPTSVIDIVAVTGCASLTSSDVTVGPWSGSIARHTGCANGSAVDQVVLANQGSDEWTVWVEVRSVDGDPDVERVLSSLKITP